MQLRCNYHPTQWAEWHCPHCQRDFCRRCVPAGHDYKLRSGGPKCVLCLKKLEYLGSAVGAPRPSQQLRVNLTFPFMANALWVYLGLTLATIPFLFLLQTPLISISVLPLLILYTLVLDYAGAILLARSEGKQSPPTWGESFKGLDILYLVKHVLTIAVGITLTTFFADMHPLLGFLAGALFLFILPAALIILTIDRSLSRAINPLLLISMVRPLLKDYLMFYAVALVLAVIYWVSLNKIMSGGGMGVIIIWYVALIGGLYACYAMLGYLMFYYQFDLGTCFVIDKGPLLNKKTYEKLRALGDSDILAAEGRFEEARQVLRATMDSVDKDLDVHQRYHQILLQTDDVEALNNHTNFYLDLLFNNGDMKTAGQVFRAAKARLPEYSPKDPAIRIALAEQLNKELDFQGAIVLLRSFHDLYPDSELTPKAYLLAATILHDKLGDCHRAAVLLKFIGDHYPNADNLNAVNALQQKIRGQL